jgi:hypothetical protein
MKTFTLKAAALAVMLTAATAAVAAPGGMSGMNGKCGMSGKCGMGGKSMQMNQMKGHSGQRGHMVRRVIDAVSKTGISAKQAAAVTDAVNTFKMAQIQFKSNKVMPIDAFGDDAFDAKRFKALMQKRFDARVGAKTKLFTSIYAILTPAQRQIFKREFTAPMVKMLIRQNMVKGYMMPGKGMNKFGGGKGCKNCN